MIFGVDPEQPLSESQAMYSKGGGAGLIVTYNPIGNTQNRRMIHVSKIISSRFFESGECINRRCFTWGIRHAHVGGCQPSGARCNHDFIYGLGWGG
jgi:hypothetical protein